MCTFQTGRCQKKWGQMMKKSICVLFSCVTAVVAGSEIRLWNGDMPGSATSETEMVIDTIEPNTMHVTNVSEPTLNLFLIESSEPSACVIICPGGGYNLLSYIKEGTEIANWFNSIGVSAAVLKYRVPKNRAGALEDAKQAVRLVRENAGKWNLDPKKIGMIGFSAGGHLTAACASSDVRPDFSVLVYPAYLFKAGSIELVDEIAVDYKTPSAFIVQTRDDEWYYRSALAYAAALDRAGVAFESHLFARGGHGYGMRDRGFPVQKLWPQLCEAWMRNVGILK